MRRQAPRWAFLVAGEGIETCDRFPSARIRRAKVRDRLVLDSRGDVWGCGACDAQGSLQSQTNGTWPVSRGRHRFRAAVAAVHARGRRSDGLSALSDRDRVGSLALQSLDELADVAWQVRVGRVSHRTKTRVTRLRLGDDAQHLGVALCCSSASVEPSPRARHLAQGTDLSPKLLDRRAVVGHLSLRSPLPASAAARLDAGRRTTALSRACPHLSRPARHTAEPGYVGVGWGGVTGVTHSGSARPHARARVSPGCRPRAISGAGYRSAGALIGHPSRSRGGGH